MVECQNKEMYGIFKVPWKGSEKGGCTLLEVDLLCSLLS
jgi:hypothetical protein